NGLRSGPHGEAGEGSGDDAGSGHSSRGELPFLGHNRNSRRVTQVCPRRRRIEMAVRTLDQHIEVTPGIAGGKPRIAGHRITVQNIAIWHERMGKSPDEIATEYDLTLADVYAALAYYFDHRPEIDQAIEEGRAFVEALRQGTP